MKKIKVYIAGPYSNGDQAVNVREAMSIADTCISEGMVPFCPHLTHFMHMLMPRKYGEWLEYDIEWLKSCDALYRIAGESSGSDKEEEEAKKLGIPVFYDLATMFAWASGQYIYIQPLHDRKKEMLDTGELMSNEEFLFLVKCKERLKRYEKEWVDVMYEYALKEFRERLKNERKND